MSIFQIDKNTYPLLQYIQINKKCYPKYLPLSCIYKLICLQTIV